MIRVLLAAALLAACAAPAFADQAKTQTKTKQTDVRRNAKQLTPEQIRRRKFEETYVDPYFEECNYMSNYGTNACGGN
jgi:hypothetical protein